MNENEYDIIIAGAGPAGCAAALSLKSSGLKVGLFDKATFPRDKICGDAIPSRAIKTLEKIDPILANKFSNFPQMLRTRFTDIIYNYKSFNLEWEGVAYTCKRVDFDNHLFDMVKKYSNVIVHECTEVKDVERVGKGYKVVTKDGQSYCKLLIGADSAQSVIAKKLASYKIDREHHIGSVRAYYKGIKDLQPDKTEVYMDKKFRSGYFWIFPVANGEANVGFGMLSTDIARTKVNIKKVLPEFIDTIPTLKDRFSVAEMIGKIEGFSLPLGSRRVKMSGDNFMLCGDAASLIDPITGDGIGNAILSGRLAGLHAMNCFESNDFSALNMKNYEDDVWKELGGELRTKTKIQRTLRKFPFLLDVAFALSDFTLVRRLVQEKF